MNVRALSDGNSKGAHRLEGIGTGTVTAITRTDLIDDVIPVTDEDAFETARKLAKLEGIFGGITSGANVWAAIQQARILGPGKKIVTIIVDSGLKYLKAICTNKYLMKRLSIVFLILIRQPAHRHNSDYVAGEDIAYYGDSSGRKDAYIASRIAELDIYYPKA